MAEIIGTPVDKGVVRPEWIDVNAHMNVTYYLVAFDRAVDALLATLGISDHYIRDVRGSTFAVECHVTWQQELKQGEAYIVSSQIAAYDAKRIHQFQRMYHATEHYLAATAEWMNLHVDLDARRVSPWPEATMEALAAFVATQGSFDAPPEFGKQMAVRNPVFKA